ncbi:MAG: YgiT-type zinc finger protein [Defluviitaleaceae bacterium]|nr:YgiT-type zinc finger protein [Defluviitaleaceae bacterium]
MCIFCKGKLHRDMTDYVESDKNLVVLVRGVPCEKCQQCGEVYFDHSTVLMLEAALGEIEIASSEITLTVMDYDKNIA